MDEYPTQLAHILKSLVGRDFFLSSCIRNFYSGSGQDYLKRTNLSAYGALQKVLYQIIENYLHNQIVFGNHNNSGYNNIVVCIPI